MDSSEELCCEISHAKRYDNVEYNIQPWNGTKCTEYVETQNQEVDVTRIEYIRLCCELCCCGIPCVGKIAFRSETLIYPGIAVLCSIEIVDVYQYLCGYPDKKYSCRDYIDYSLCSMTQTGLNSVFGCHYEWKKATYTPLSSTNVHILFYPAKRKCRRQIPLAVVVSCISIGCFVPRGVSHPWCGAVLRCRGCVPCGP